MGIEEDSYTDIRSLRKDVIEKAVRDINKLSNLNAEFEADRIGRKIVGFTFKVWSKSK